MKFSIFFYISILNINSFLFLSENSDTIRFAFILSRTGSHSPSKLKQIDSSNFIYKDIFGYEWPLGENELTNVGKRQQFYVGCHNNLKYKNILFSEIYHPKELLAVSSECNKTIQSSYANLHGLYQNSSITLTNNQINNAVPPLNSNKGYIDAKNELDKNKLVIPNNIQIVPVHTFYEKDHNYLLEKVENCPSIKKFYDEGKILAKKKREEILNYKSEENNEKTYGEILVEILNEEKIFNEVYNINYLKTNSTFFEIMAETFICDYFNAVNLEKFIQKKINIYKLLQLFEEYFGEISIGGGLNNSNEERKKKTYELSKNVNYDLFNGLLEWIKIRIDNDIQKKFDILLYESPKIVLYLSHHESIESLYYFLKETFNIRNAKSPLYVNFTSFIGIELYRKNNDKDEYNYNDFYIKLIYDNEQFGNDISYKEFSEAFKKKIISLNDLQDYCGIGKNDNDIYSNEQNLKYIIIGTILMCFFPILASIALFIFFRKKKKDFEQFPEEIVNNNSNDSK